MEAHPKVVLVGVQTPSQTPEHFEASLAELARLCDTRGFEVVGRLTQKRPGTGAANLLGDGKLRELARWTDGPGVVKKGPERKKYKGQRSDEPEVDEDEDADEEPVEDPTAEPKVKATLVAVDTELSPSQLRNLQSAAGCEVLDRTGIILEIFHRHAKSREAKLQVELARLAYLAPRLRETGSSERQRGGIGGKGAGESDVELDKRKVRDRMAELREELARIEAERSVRRQRRRTERQVAIVGYTNAGKSSLLRALTGSDPFVADRLFATLDIQSRRLVPEVVPPILVTDTVGFIRDLPHDLVASFRSTLDAALDASLLLHVVDAADPDLDRQIEVTAEVLGRIGADEIPRQLVLNKCDKLPPGHELALADRYPDAWRTSAVDPARVAALHAAIVGRFDQELEEAEVFVPWARAAALGAVRQETQVLAEQHEDEGVRYRLRGTPAAVGRVRAAVSSAAR